MRFGDPFCVMINHADFNFGTNIIELFYNMEAIAAVMLVYNDDDGDDDDDDDDDGSEFYPSKWSSYGLKTATTMINNTGIGR